MAARIKIPAEVEADVIYKTDYKCCVCQNGKRGDHIHHIDGNNTNNKIDNLAFLCFPHHDDASKKGLSKGLNPKAVKKFRDKWYEEVEDIRQKRRHIANAPIGEINEDHLLSAALTANIIIEIIKIREKYLDADRNNIELILGKLHPYAEYTNQRISYEVFLFLSHVARRARTKTSTEIISSVYWLASAFYIRGEDDKEHLISYEAIRLGSDLIYDGTIYAKNLGIVAYGCNILKLVYQYAASEGKKELRDKVLETYLELENEFKRRTDQDYSKSLETMQVFKNDLGYWGLAFPIFPDHLKDEIF